MIMEKVEDSKNKKKHMIQKNWDHFENEYIKSWRFKKKKKPKFRKFGKTLKLVWKIWENPENKYGKVEDSKIIRNPWVR